MKPEFINKFANNKYVVGLKKEAKRVGYTVNSGLGFFEVVDPDNSNAVVLKGVNPLPDHWHLMFAKDYWMDSFNINPPPA